MYCYIDKKRLAALVAGQWLTKDSVEVTSGTLAEMCGVAQMTVIRWTRAGVFGNAVRNDGQRKLYNLGNSLRIIQEKMKVEV